MIPLKTLLKNELPEGATMTLVKENQVEISHPSLTHKIDVTLKGTVYHAFYRGMRSSFSRLTKKESLELIIENGVRKQEMDGLMNNLEVINGKERFKRLAFILYEVKDDQTRYDILHREGYFDGH